MAKERNVSSPVGESTLGRPAVAIHYVDCTILFLINSVHEIRVMCILFQLIVPGCNVCITFLNVQYDMCKHHILRSLFRAEHIYTNYIRI
jgi:hypothetical protein